MSEISYKTVCKNKNYLLLLSANLINRMGDSIDTIAFSWLVYAFTGEGTWAALVFAVNKIPSVVILPLAGAYVEKKVKKQVMICCDVIRAVLVAVLLASILMGRLSLIMLLLFSFFISLAEAFRVPAGTSFITQLLDEEELSYGVSLSVLASMLAEVAGTGIAGLIISGSGVRVAFGIDIATFVISILLIALIRHKEKIAEDMKAENSLLIFKKGIQYIKEKKSLLYVILFAMFANAIMAPVDSLQTPVVVEVLGRDAAYLSILNICLTAGMLLAGAAYPMLKNKIKPKRLFIYSCVYIAGLYLLLSIMSDRGITAVGIWYYVGIICYLFYGIFAGFLATGLGIVLLEHTEQEYMARTNTIYSALGEAVIPVISAATGIVIKFLQLKDVFFIISVGILAVLLIIAFLTPRIVKN